MAVPKAPEYDVCGLMGPPGGAGLRHKDKGVDIVGGMKLAKPPGDPVERLGRLPSG